MDINKTNSRLKEEEVMLEVEITFSPEVMDTCWKVKKSPEHLSEEFKKDLYYILGIDIDKIINTGREKRLFVQGEEYWDE
jgi:hypothetical protein